MSNFRQMYKKPQGSTSSQGSSDSAASVKVPEATAKHPSAMRMAEPPQREPLKQTENVMRTQNNVIRTENSLNKVSCNLLMALTIFTMLEH